MSFILLYFLSLVPAGTGWAQVPDTMANRKNIVKINLTSRFLYNSAYVVSYERIVKKNQSFGMTAGYIQFPNVFPNGGRIELKRDMSTSGFTVGAEYRFYLAKENRYEGPHGVYIGPYASVYSFQNERLLSSTDPATNSQASMQSGITFTNIGFQIGYQFILNNRWAIDMIFFGPSITNYFMDLKLNGDFTPTEEQEVLDKLVDKFPFLGDFLSGEELSANGRTSKWGGGYRYSLQVGYRFGSKKKK